MHKQPTSGNTVRRPARARMSRKTRGAVMVEYAFLLAFVAVPTAIGCVAGGLKLLKNFQTVQAYMLDSSP
jgi:Flp pilus assembly pilin Flp